MGLLGTFKIFKNRSLLILMLLLDAGRVSSALFFCLLTRLRKRNLRKSEGQWLRCGAGTRAGKKKKDSSSSWQRDDKKRERERRERRFKEAVFEREYMRHECWARKDSKREEPTDCHPSGRRVTVSGSSLRQAEHSLMAGTAWLPASRISGG